MSQRIQAIYRNGVFYPLQPLDYKEGEILNITIIEILGDASKYIENIRNVLSQLDEDERRHLEKEIENQ